MVKAEDTEANIRALYADLNKFGKSEEFEKAIKIANKSKFTNI